MCHNIVNKYGNNTVSDEPYGENYGRNTVRHVIDIKNIADRIVTVCRPYCEQPKQSLLMYVVNLQEAYWFLKKDIIIYVLQQSKKNNIINMIKFTT